MVFTHYSKKYESFVEELKKLRTRAQELMRASCLWVIPTINNGSERVKIEKMRHVRHSMEKQAMEVTNAGVTLLGPLFD